MEATNILTSLICAVVTTRIRGVRSEVRLSQEVGLSRESVINCDNLETVQVVSLDTRPVGRLDPISLRKLDIALIYALGIEAA